MTSVLLDVPRYFNTNQGAANGCSAILQHQTKPQQLMDECSLMTMDGFYEYVGRFTGRDKHQRSGVAIILNYWILVVSLCFNSAHRYLLDDVQLDIDWSFRFNTNALNILNSWRPILDKYITILEVQCHRNNNKRKSLESVRTSRKTDDALVI